MKLAYVGLMAGINYAYDPTEQSPAEDRGSSPVIVDTSQDAAGLLTF